MTYELDQFEFNNNTYNASITVHDNNFYGELVITVESIESCYKHLRDIAIQRCEVPVGLAEAIEKELSEDEDLFNDVQRHFVEYYA